MDCCPIMARHVGEAVMKRARKFDMQSRLDGNTKHQEIAQLQWDDLQVGRLLGQGSFSSVYQVQVIQDEPHKEQPACIGALKILRRESMSCLESFESGAIDLVMEAKIIARLNHENIIKLYATKGGCLSRSFFESGYFLVLERLYGTLDEKLRMWEKLQKVKNPMTRLRCTTTTFEEEDVPCLLQRLDSIALGVARAMEYLHSQQICLRDLKPHNIGFGKHGTVKIFDLGLALELNHHNAQDTDCPFSGQVGTRRYMAPENALCKPYGLPSDVYSFGVVLWEICTLRVAYKKMTPSQHAERVVLAHERPSIKRLSSCSPQLKALMEACWDPSPEERPDFKTVCTKLKQEQSCCYYGTNDVDRGDKRRLLRSVSLPKAFPSSTKSGEETTATFFTALSPEVARPQRTLPYPRPGLRRYHSEGGDNKGASIEAKAA